jgi:hypothetical protein
MATTTNYGWTTPDDTDLVKDGAAAIRTLGSSVDTTTKALNPSTTTGDIEYRSATANTNARLALGTAGQVLRVNSGATAPEWATPSGGGLVFITSSAFSASSTVSVNNCFTSTYANYRVVLDCVGSAELGIDCRLRASGSDDSAATYNTRRSILASGYSSSYNATNTSFAVVIAQATNRSAAVLDFINPEASLQTNALTNASYEPSANGRMELSGLTFTNTTQFDGFSLICASGNITGTVRVYGYANS